MRASSGTQRIRHAATVYVEFIRLAVLANDVHFFCTKETNQRKVPGNLLFNAIARMTNPEKVPQPTAFD